MSNYNKASLQTIKDKIRAGGYDTLAGANRAIGKTQELSDGDKAKAKEFAAKHFGAAAAAPKKVTKKAVKKVAKKAAVKAAPKPRAAKKAVKKAARKVRSSASSEADTSQAPAVTPARTPVNSGKPAARAPVTNGVNHRSVVINQMGSVIGNLDQVLKSMEFAQKIFPKAQLEQGVNTTIDTLARAVRVLDREAVSPLLPEAERRTPVNKQRNRRSPATSSSNGLASSTEEQETGDGPDPAAADGVDGGDGGDLTDEEQEQLELAKDIQPTAMASAGLKRVPPGLGGTPAS